jgi:hypothetical protein
MILAAVVRYSVWVEDGSVIVKFRTLQSNEDALMNIIDGLEHYLAPDSVTIIEGWRQDAWLHVVISVDGYEKEYVEKLLRDRAWLRGIKLIKVVEAEVEVE